MFIPESELLFLEICCRSDFVTDFQDMTLKLFLNLEREKLEKEQLIVKTQEEKKILGRHNCLINE